MNVKPTCCVRLPLHRAFVMLVALGATLPMSARVGETLEQLEARFGPRFEAGVDEVNPSNQVFGFDAKGVSALCQSGFSAYAVIDFRGVCVQLSYVKLAGRAINEDDLRAMLTANSGGYGWKSVRGNKRSITYVRADGLVGWLARPDRFELMLPERAQERGIRDWDS